MKLAVILLLAAGPLAVYGQRAENLFSPWRPPAVKLPMRSGVGPRSIYDETLVRPFPENLYWSVDGGKPKSLYARNSIRILLPDRMPCLVPGPVNDHMKIDLRGNADKMPNSIRRLP